MGLFRKIATFPVAFLLLVSTTDTVISAHLCSGGLFSLSMFREADTCGCAGGEEESDMKCCNDPEPDNNSGCCAGGKEEAGQFPVQMDHYFAVDSKSCCSDILISERGIDILCNTSPANYETRCFQVSILPGDPAFLARLPGYNRAEFITYSPPAAGRDIPVLVQSFLL